MRRNLPSRQCDVVRCWRMRPSHDERLLICCVRAGQRAQPNQPATGARSSPVRGVALNRNSASARSKLRGPRAKAQRSQRAGFCGQLLHGAQANTALGGGSYTLQADRTLLNGTGRMTSLSSANAAQFVSISQAAPLPDGAVAELLSIFATLSLFSVLQNGCNRATSSPVAARGGGRLQTRFAHKHKAAEV